MRIPLDSSSSSHRKVQYLTHFEVLANRIVRLPPPFLLNCFISDLDLDILCEVQALQPLTLVHAAGLVRLQEEKIHENRKGLCGRMPLGPNFSSPLPTIIPSPTPNIPLLPSPAKPPPLPLKRLTPEELASRRERRLCFNCDEKFTRGHCCASRFFLLVADEEQGDEAWSPKIASPYPHSDDPTCTDPQNNPHLTQPQTELLQAQISLHALSGQTAPETFG